MSDIFLSYATEDRPRTRLLVRALEERGWSVWWDRTILPAERWANVIEEALDAARCAVVLWSKTSVTSDWVRNEAEEAAGRKILVPVLIDDVKPPFAFRGVQAARLIGWTGDKTDEEFGKLVRAIAKMLGTGEGCLHFGGTVLGDCLGKQGQRENKQCGTEKKAFQHHGLS